MENVVASRMKQLNAEAADESMVEIAAVCAKKVKNLKLTPQKDFLGSIACVAPKYCPALYRELADCYHDNQRSTRPCRAEVINVFACVNDFSFRKSELFFVHVDGLKSSSIPHPSASQQAQARILAATRPL